MKHNWLIPAAIAFLGACGGAKTIETGPKLDVTLTCNFTNVQNNDFGGASETTRDCQPDSTTKDYPIQISVIETDGDKHNDGMENENTKYPAKTYTTTLTIGDSAPTSPAIKPSDSGRSLESDPISVPAASKGQTVKLHIEATDERGLGSNKVDLQVLLN